MNVSHAEIMNLYYACMSLVQQGQNIKNELWSNKVKT